MRFFILFFSLIISFSGFAQGPYVLFKVAPLALIDDVSFPTVQGGVEVALTPHISWYNEFGVRYRKGNYEKFDTNYVSTSGYKAKTEFRYYFEGNKKKKDRFCKQYVGINYFYTRHVYNSAFQYYYQNDSSYRTNDGYGVTKAVWGINLITGWQYNIGKRFMVEVYGGLGVRFRDIETVGQEFVYERDKVVLPRHPYVLKGIYDRQEAKGGKSGTLNITSGVRISCKLY